MILVYFEMILQDCARMGTASTKGWREPVARKTCENNQAKQVSGQPEDGLRRWASTGGMESRAQEAKAMGPWLATLRRLSQGRRLFPLGRFALTASGFYRAADD